MVGSLRFPIFPWWVHRVHAVRGRLFEARIGVIAFVSHPVFGLNPLDQGAGLYTFRNQDSDWQTRGLHGPGYLGVEPPWVRLIF